MSIASLRVRYPAAAAAVLIALLVLPGASFAETPPSTLTDELLGNGAVPPGSELVITGTCEAGYSDFTFESSGVAEGPYAGTFVETGYFTLSPAVATFPGDTIGTRKTVEFEADFVIEADGFTIHGTKIFAGRGVGECNATEEPNEAGAGVGASSNAAFQYEAFIETPDGTYRDEGEGSYTLREFTFADGSTAKGFDQHFSSYLEQPDPPPPSDPPVVAAVSFPTQVENGPEPVSFTVTATMTDDVGILEGGCVDVPEEDGGGQSCSGSAVSFWAPRGDATATGWFTRVTGDVYEAEVTFPAYAAIGTWTPQVGAADTDYQYAVLGSEQLAAAGFPSGIEVTGTDDTTPPIVVSIGQLSTNRVNISDHAAREVRVDVEVVDDLSGVYTVTPIFRSNSGNAYYASSDDIGSGIYSGAAQFYDADYLGDWYLASVRVEDVVGNSTEYFPDSPREFEVVSEPPVNLYGRVTAGDEGVGGASISIYQDDEQQEWFASTQTDAAGYYETSTLPAGAYLIDVYPPTDTDNFLLESSAHVVLGSEALEANFDLRSFDVTSVRGQVLLEDGVTAVPNTTMIVCWTRDPCVAPRPETAGGGSDAKMGYIDSTGHYSIDRVPVFDGPVTFAVWDPDHGASVVVGTSQLTASENVVNLTLPRAPGSVVGTLRYTSGDPVISAGISWRYCGDDAELARQVRRTDSLGHFAIHSLAAAPGCITIEADDNDGTRATIQADVNYTSSPFTRDLTLGPFPNTGGLRFVVTDTRGTPVANASIYVHVTPNDGEIEPYLEDRDGVTGTNGLSSMQNIEPSTADIWVTAYSGTPMRTRIQVTTTVGTNFVTVPVTMPAAVQGAGGIAQLGTAVTATNPVTTAVANPAGGPVTIVEGDQLLPSGEYRFLGRELDITARDASVEDPIQLTFTVHSSLLGGADPSTITVLRNGDPAADCAQTDPVADPDPCVYSRTAGSDGNLTLLVLTSHASAWSIVAPAANTARDGVESAVDTLQALVPTLTGKPAIATTKALDALRKSLTASWWLSDERLDAKSGSKVFDSHKLALKELTKKELAGNGQIADAVASILDAERALAQTAIDDGLAAGVKAKTLDAARASLAGGDVSRAAGDYEKALDRYRSAWETAQKTK